MAELHAWIFGIRAGFWTCGLLGGAILLYATRHYVNGDAIAYLDMAEAFRKGVWSQGANLTYAPGYSILLAIFQSVCPVQPVNEVFQVKALNYISFLAGMGACDFFLAQLRHGALVENSKTSTLPFPALQALCYSTFLIACLAWIRVQIIAPDMVVFVIVLLAAAVLLKITRMPERYGNFWFLGLIIGLGYTFKTFFFPFSAVLLGLAWASCASWKRAVPRVAVSVAVMLSVAAPLVLSQSRVAGKLSFGEAGNYNYSRFVAGEGQKIHTPELIHRNPDVLFYRSGVASTYPPAVDPAYWSLGIHPVFNLKAQLRALHDNVQHLVGRIFWPAAVVVVWFLMQLGSAVLPTPKVYPPSPFVTLGVIALAGTFMYCLIVMEIRYVGPFVFLGLIALYVLPRYDFSKAGKLYRSLTSVAVVVALILGTLVYAIADQCLRALHSSNEKASHRATFGEAFALREFINSGNIGKGDMVAIVLPFQAGLFWARMAGVRLTAEVSDSKVLFLAAPTEREKTLRALEEAGIKAIVAKVSQFSDINSEGWEKVPGTIDYFVYFFNHDGHSPQVRSRGEAYPNRND